MKSQPDLGNLARRQALADSGTFQETGSINGVPIYADEGNTNELTPINIVCQHGRAFAPAG